MNLKITNILYLILGVILMLPAAVCWADCEKPELPKIHLGEYYKTAIGKTENELKNSLHETIKGHIRYKYKCVWKILEYADGDPVNPDNVLLIYTQRSTPKSNKDQGQNDPDSWNREHVWAKSHGFPSKNQHAYTDTHHIRAADRSVNTARSNKEFDSDGNPHNECLDCKKDSDSWYPGNRAKGDVARMMFYMDVRYQGDDGNTPDLELVNFITRKPQGTAQNEKFGILCKLFQWHLEDPVNKFEKKRNNRVYEWQGNRNPFIDHPEWITAIWGKKCLCDSD